VWYGTTSYSALAAQYGADVTGLSATISRLTNGTVYYVWVKAKNSGGTSDFSLPASGTPEDSGISSDITYSGSTWVLQEDGRRKSPAIGGSQTTITRYAFTSTRSNASLVIHLDVSSESSYDYAFVGNLDSTASMSSYYDRISGSTSKTITITVPTAGSHFVEIGYGKDSGTISGSDCAWFTIE
jgi:hypothetical protein